MTDYTPGPWAYDPKINRVYSLINDVCVASPHIIGNKFCEEAWPADARLIAAAPELLDALELMVKLFDHCGLNGLMMTAKRYGWTASHVQQRMAACRIARAAIAKAEGRS
jgi:hypothetical protein